MSAKDIRNRALTAIVLLAFATPAAAASGAAGARIARAYCAGCHAVSRAGSSPLAEAPPFRDLSRRGDLATLLSQGMIVTPGPQEEGDGKRHPLMPRVTLDEAELGDLLAYLRSIQTPRGRPI
ncbi:MAG: c-type cytochrome [Caulobacteraceae bacterium]